MLASYHNHTTWSDGRAPVAEVIEHAAALGLGEVGISDHYTLHPGGRSVSWSMPTARVGAYVGDVLAGAEESRAAGGPVVRVGLEVDWFPSQGSALRRALDDLPLDYTIGSVHFVGDAEIDGHPAVWRRWTADQRDEVHCEYWRRVRQMARSGLFDIVGHLDLPKKFGFHPRCDVGGLIAEALDAIAAAPMVVELNTDGWHRPCREAYPAPPLLEACRRRGIAVTISADAHQPKHLLRDFAAAARQLIEAGYDEVARFARREVSWEPIASAVPET